MNKNLHIYKIKSSFLLLKFFIFVFGKSLQRIKYDLSNSTSPEFWIHPAILTPVILLFRDLSITKMTSLIDFSLQDYIGKKFRFIAFYIFVSYNYNVRLYFFSQIKLTYPLLSLTSIFKSAGWLEREVLDMFGVYFLGNNFMVRILTDYGFKGFPLRKDFPLTGFEEIYYDDSEKRIIYDVVELMQEYRTFKLNLSIPA